MQIVEFRAMNTGVVLAAEETDGSAAALQATRRFVELCEQRFSRFRPESELSALNRSAGTWFQASTDMIDLLQQSLEYHRLTGRLFDPSILPDLKRAGYDRKMDEVRRSGAAAASVNGRPGLDFQSLEIDPTRRRVRLPIGMEIDLGGIAKGWIVQKASEILSAYSPNCAVSAGGDIVFLGHPADGELWQIRIEDPWDSSREVTRLGVGPGAVATSSLVKRSWNQDGIHRHHLIDPRTGEPAFTDWASVTTLAPSITAAEVYAKALLIGGAGEAPGLLAHEPGLSFFAVTMDGTPVSSFAQEELSDGYEFRVRQ